MKPLATSSQKPSLFSIPLTLIFKFQFKTMDSPRKSKPFNFTTDLLYLVLPNLPVKT